MLRGGETIHLGDRDLQVFHTPGHAPGHMCFWEAERGYLFTGDLIYQGLLTAWFSSTDPQAYLKSLEQVAQLPCSRLFPGHHDLDLPPELRLEMRDKPAPVGPGGGAAPRKRHSYLWGLGHPAVMERGETKMKIRDVQPGDGREMAELFYNTVHRVNARDYTPQQLAVWATGKMDLEAWEQSFMGHCALVAEDETGILGFGDIYPDGYLDRLYVRWDCQGQGIARALCDRLEGAVSGPVTTHASITARPFFEARGYRVVRQQQVERQGVALTNFVMEKPVTEIG